MPVWLNFGVIDQPYVTPPPPPAKRRGRGKAPKKPPPAPRVVTTGDVAGWLENKYHIYEIFFESNIKEIQKMLISSVESAMVTHMMNGTGVADPFRDAEQEIQHAFVGWLGAGTIEGLGIPGVPTMAAQNRESLRFKSGKASIRKDVLKRLRAAGLPEHRPSFIDTGLYVDSFRAWVTTGRNP